MSKTRARKGAGQLPHQRQAEQQAGSSPPPPTAAPASGPDPVPAADSAVAGKATGWVGWVYFAAVLMTIAGTFEIVAGLTALFSSGYFLVGAQDLLVSADFTVWGWLHIALGAIAVGAGLGLFTGQMWARVVGIAMAMVSAVVNFAFLAAHPAWTIMLIALDVVIIYAIAVHGKEVAANRALPIMERSDW
jgi:hypothetical protein